ncbi:hypothetical protein BGZ99_000402, partial [Dissophora globulifera]
MSTNITAHRRPLMASNSIGAMANGAENQPPNAPEHTVESAPQEDLDSPFLSSRVINVSGPASVTIAVAA